MKLLVIDDDPTMLDLIGCYLPIDQDYELECYATAELALEKLSSGHFRYDCILLDIMLPGVDGIECCRLLRQLKPYQTTPILMMTASQELGLMQRAFDLGATDFLCKPLNSVELRARVKSASMLNHSIAKAQHSLQELDRQTRLRFDDMLSLNVEGVYHLEALERSYLRYGQGCYMMSLVSMVIPEMRYIYSSTTPLHYRECIQKCAQAMIDVMRDNSKIAHLGKGRFIGVSHGRDRINLPDLTSRFNLRLSECWDCKETNVRDVPTGSFTLASDQRIWSGLSMANKLYELGLGFDEEIELSPRDDRASIKEYNIFAQLNW